MKLYIAGCMTDRPQYGFNDFELAATTLRAAHHIVSPHWIDIADGRVTVKTRFVEGRIIYDDVQLNNDFSYDDTLIKDYGVILGCDGLVALPGWMRSVGARREVAVACLAKKYLFDWVPESGLVMWDEREQASLLERIEYEVHTAGLQTIRKQLA